jgi:hypothetical protein
MYNFKLSDFNYNKYLKNIIDILPPCNIETGPWIGGGAVRRLILNEPFAGDIDIFFKNKEQLNEWKMYFQYSITKNNLEQKDSHTTPNSLSICIDKNSIDAFLGYAERIKKVKPPNKVISLYDLEKIEHMAKKYNDDVVVIQLIHKYFVNNVNDLWSKFDFTVCQIFTDGENILCNDETVDDLHKNYLRISNDVYDIDNSLLRISKYCSLDYIPVPGTYSKILKHPKQTFSTFQQES